MRTARSLTVSRSICCGTHDPRLACRPPCTPHHTHPSPCHTCPPPCTPPATYVPPPRTPPPHGQTDTCKKKPSQTSFAGGNNQLQTMIRVHSHLRFITRLRLRLRFLSMGWIGIAITTAKMDAQPIFEPNGNYNRNRVINQRYEWTTKDCSHSVIASAIFYHNKCRIKCKCSRGAIWIMTLNSIQPINYDKQIAVTIPPCECTFMVHSHLRFSQLLCEP